MPQFIENDEFQDSVDIIDMDDPVVGGENGVSNEHGRIMANRTRYLLNRIEDLISGELVAGKAGQLNSPITVTLQGAVDGSITFDGSDDVSSNISVKNNAHSHVVGNVAGLQSELDGKLDVNGTAVKANKLTTPRTISLGGDASGSVSFDGSANKTLTVAVKDDSHKHVINNVDGLQTALNTKAPLSSPLFTGAPRGPVPSSSDDSNRLPTTSWVKDRLGGKLDVNGKAANSNLLDGYDHSHFAKLANYNLNSGESGYLILPNGFIVQWGRSNEIDPHENKPERNNIDVFFPMFFENNCFAVIPTFTGGPGAFVGKVKKYKYKFKCELNDAFHTYNFGRVEYIAIGY